MRHGPETNSLDLLIAHVLLGKPNITPSLLRRIIPNLQGFDNRALGQRIERVRAEHGRRPRLLH
jgi:hypothetical protein